MNWQWCQLSRIHQVVFHMIQRRQHRMQKICRKSLHVLMDECRRLKKKHHLQQNHKVEKGTSALFFSLTKTAIVLGLVQASCTPYSYHCHYHGTCWKRNHNQLSLVTTQGLPATINDFSSGEGTRLHICLCVSHLRVAKRLECLRYFEKLWTSQGKAPVSGLKNECFTQNRIVNVIAVKPDERS